MTDRSSIKILAKYPDTIEDIIKLPDRQLIDFIFDSLNYFQNLTQVDIIGHPLLNSLKSEIIKRFIHSNDNKERIMAFSHSWTLENLEQFIQDHFPDTKTLSFTVNSLKEIASKCEEWLDEDSRRESLHESLLAFLGTLDLSNFSSIDLTHSQKTDIEGHEMKYDVVVTDSPILHEKVNDKSFDSYQEALDFLCIQSGFSIVDALENE